MNSAQQVADLIAKGKANGVPLSDLAWQAALACVGWAYVFGAYGDWCDPSNRRSRARDSYPTIKSACKNFNGSDNKPGGCVGCKWFLGTADSNPETHEGRTRFFDCRGFVYWILKQVFGFQIHSLAGATTMWNTESNWKAKGEINTCPKDTLVCLFVRKGSKMEHIGFGLNNETVECSSGVQHFTARKAKWTHWAIPVCVDSGATPTPTPTPTPDPKPEKGTAIVTGKNVALRSGPSTSATVILRVPTGKVVKIETPPSDWEYVEYNGKKGYMMKQYLKEG